MTSSRDRIREAQAGLQAQGAAPRMRRSVVTCMDARIDPLRLFDAGRGDIHVIRNAGGLVTADVVRSLLVSQYRLGTRRIDLVMHTDCGMLDLDEAALTDEIAAATGVHLDVRWGSFSDIEAELARGVAALRESEALRDRSQITGRIYDVAANRMRTVIS